MCNWVDPYCAYDGTSYWRIGMWTPTAFTFDNTTDTLEAVAHGLSNNDEVLLTTTGTFPSGVNPNQVYYVVNKTTDDFQISDVKNGTAITFTTNGTGTQSFSKLGQPRCRYIQYLGDRLYGAWDDANPISLYYTAAAPSNGNTLNANVVIIWGDENGVINWLNEYNQLVLSFKSQKVYTVNVWSSSIQAVDAQTGWYSDRTIQVVWNQLTYFNERGIDTLNKRYGVDWTWAIESKPLSDSIRELTKDITERQYNSSTSLYIKPVNNYYFSFDTNDDNIPDTTTVLNSTVNAWTQYVGYPNLYDYWYYVNSDWEYQFLMASAINGQMYQMEYGFDDNGEAIDVEIQTKDFDFNQPWSQKSFKFVDITGYKAAGDPISVMIKVDSNTVRQWFITDANLDMNNPTVTLGSNVIWVETIGASSSDADNDLILYPFTFRVPFYARGATIAVNMSSSGVQRIMEKMKIDVNAQPMTVFNYSNLG